MRKLILFSFFILVANICSAQLVKYGSLKPYLGMKGNVESVTEESFGFSLDKEGNEKRTLQGKWISEFAENGDLKRKTFIDGRYETVISYLEYNKGRAVRFNIESRTPLGVDNDSIRLFVVSEYKDSLVSWNRYNRDFASMDTTLIRYDPILNDVILMPLANNRRLQIRERYDGQGNLIDERRLLRGDVKSWTLWTYNEEGLLVERNNLEPDYSLTRFSYREFDEYGNWKERITQNESGEEIGIMIREIKYRK